MLLTVTVLTYKRPADLAAILPLLLEQALSVQSAELSVEILVVDNEPSAGARDQVTAFTAESSRIHIRYENEVTPGISAARNRALDATNGSDLIVFIDDDERPRDGWLASLLLAKTEFRADAVVGPVISEYEFEPDPWILAGDFFRRRRLPTGSALTVAATNNLLLDLACVRSLNMRFDLDFGITGGDDTMFTRQFHQRGATMVWCDEAIVVDAVPAKRLTRKWVLQRAFSSGNTWSLVALKIEPNCFLRQTRRLELGVRASVRIVAGFLRAAFGYLALSMRHQAKGSRTLARGAGMMAGAWGYGFEEYKR